MSAVTVATRAAATRPPPAVEDILTVLLPTAAETALLRACLHSGSRARDGWTRWTAGRDATDARMCLDLSETRTLAPLLAQSVSANDLEAGRSVRAYLRAATLREHLRAERFREVAAEVLDCLEHGGTQPVVVRGTALAATVYETWSLRHCHDLDLLIRREELSSAIRALGELDCTPAGPPEVMRIDALVEHPSGMKIALHTRPFALRYYESDLDWFDSSRQQNVVIDGVTARVTVPEATVVHVLGHATYSASQRNLRWVPDLSHLLQRSPRLDWAAIVSLIEAHRLELPVALLLRYLMEFGLPVPHDVIDHLRRSARDAGSTREDAAVKGAVAVVGGSSARLWLATRSWRGRMRLARWAVAPSPAYVRSSFPNARGWRLPLCYAHRAARFVARPH